MIKSRLKMLTLADSILIIIIILGALGSYTHFHKKINGLYAYIYINNSLFGAFPLSQDRLINIKSGFTAEIKDNKIRVIEADCKDKRCVKQGWSDLLPIICLPNRIVIEIKAENSKKKMHLLY